MDLQEFVSQTLVQIIQGVKDAQQEARKHGGKVNPDQSHSPFPGKDIQNVEFDVALTVTEGTGTKGGMGLVVGPLALGTQGESKAQNSSVSRVRFSVPVRLPEFERVTL